MGDLEAYRGIFIQSEESNVEFREACIKELKPVCNSPIIRAAEGNAITGNGIRIYFKDKETVKTVLSRRKLVVSGQRYDMCPLVTHLTIHTVIPNTEHDVEKDLSNKMKRYLAPVLKINELPLSKKCPSVLSANWRTIIDIPEFRALEAFQNSRKFKKRKSDESNIEFFYTEDHLKLSFFCPMCEEDGHILQHCKMLYKRRIIPAITKPSAQNIRKNTSFQEDGVASTSSIREQTSPETVGQPREECSTSTERPSKRIISRRREYQKYLGGRLKTILGRKSEAVRSTSRAPSSSQPVRTTPPTRNIHSSVSGNSESHNPRRRKSVIGQIRILPNSRIEECIQKAGGTCRLSQPQLENFFNHVKGKKDIRRILKMYKNMHKVSEKALKEQLNEIVGLYYVSKLPETKEEKTLIRWLQCLVERLNKKH